MLPISARIFFLEAAFIALVAGGTAQGQTMNLKAKNINSSASLKSAIFTGAGNSIEANSTTSFVGGGYSNKVGSNWACVLGGGYNTARGFAATVGGGNRNLAQGTDATVAGGHGNHATNDYASIGGGYMNTASGFLSTVSGGYTNTASGQYATVPGGYQNSAIHNGSFVWGDGTEPTASSGDNTFTVRGTGGAIFLTGSGSSAGVFLPSGGTSWASLSDRNAKTDFEPVDKKKILAKVASLPVTSWHYKHDLNRRYIGPTSQDFYAAFGLGANDKSISTLDSDGVMYASIQGLMEELKERDHAITTLGEALAWQKLQNDKALAERDMEIDNMKEKIDYLRNRLDTLAPPSRD